MMSGANDAPQSKIQDNPVRTKRSSAKLKPWTNLPPECHPKQRIFLSIDAIGSTLLKSSLSEDGGGPGKWAHSFLAFLPEVAIVYWGKFVEMVNTHCPLKKCTKPCVPKNIRSKATPVFPYTEVKAWKYIGDEVVLVAELTCKDHHASLHILALAETLKHFNNNYAKKKEPANKLRFKGTAWVAAFPVTNIEIELPRASEDEENEPIKDFLGPSMDLGFRLSRFASEDRLVVSASLAHLIVSAPAMKAPMKSYRGGEESSLPLCFGGSADAKGIKNGKHPLIWFSVQGSNESELCRVEKEKLLTFLNKNHFLPESTRPFILDDNHTDPQYDAEYKKAVAEQKKIPYSIFNKKLKKRRPPNVSKSRRNLDAESVISRIPPAP